MSELQLLKSRLPGFQLATLASTLTNAWLTPIYRKDFTLPIPTEPVLSVRTPKENIDESGWKDRGIKYWIWVFCTSAISFLYITKSRSSQVLRDILGETYNGTIVSDFFSAYVKYANKIQSAFGGSGSSDSGHKISYNFVQ